MNFRAPRDPNTKSGIVALRTIPDGEYWPCHVGSGECKEPAIEAHDDCAGGEFLVCVKHLPEIHALAKLLAEMTDEKVKEFASAIDACE